MYYIPQRFMEACLVPEGAAKFSEVCVHLPSHTVISLKFNSPNLFYRTPGAGLGKLLLMSSYAFCIMIVKYPGPNNHYY